MTQNRFFSKALELFESIDTMQTAVASDNSILIQQLEKSEHLAAYLLTQSTLPKEQQGKSVVALAGQISNLFNNDELTSLCIELGEDIQDLEGSGKSAKSLSLVDRMRRTGRLTDIVTLLKAKRPAAVWPKAEQIILPKIIKKNDLAIVVGSIHRRDGSNVLRDVAHYLEERDIDCNLLFFTSYGKIPLSADWNSFPKIFRDVVDVSLAQTGAKTGHFFLAGTGAVLFSMGCMWSTIKNCVIYHDQGGYNPVIHLPLE